MKFSQDPFDSRILGQDVYKFIIEHDDQVQELNQTLQTVKKRIIFGFTPVQSRYTALLERNHFHCISIRNTYQYVGAQISPAPLPEGFTVAPFSGSETIAEGEITALA